MNAGPSRVERILNLLACLLDTARPLTRDELVEQVTGYPPEPVAYRRAFERDKETLRAMGVPLVVVNLPSGEQGYRVPPDEYFLPDLDLTDEETAALHVAVSAVLLGNRAGQGALMKLGGATDEASAPIGTLPLEPALPLLFEAFRRHCPVTFEYRGDTRTVEPWGLAARRGHWYLVGHDRTRGAMRTFRADRLGDDISVGEPESFVVPDDFSPDQSLDNEPWQYGDDAPVTARVLVDAGHADDVVARADRVVETRADGSVVVELEVVNVPAFRSFVLGLLDHGEVLEPEALRADLLAYLGEFAT
ncbi:MAG TPA: WYL domain-containing protein [Acidimicrobiia bacterium]|jgi:proteasome accessory factor B|nr:WYL domain-containing protein [Acidimicrobiia bacterium]